MKPIVAVVAAPLVASTFAAATPAAAETVFVGNAYIVGMTSSSACSAFTIGDNAQVIYRPAGNGTGNGKDSWFAYVGNRSATTLKVAGGVAKSGAAYTGYWYSTRMNYGGASGTVTSWSINPATLTATTPHATLTTSISNFFGNSGCSIDLQADLELAK